MSSIAAVNLLCRSRDPKALGNDWNFVQRLFLRGPKVEMILVLFSQPRKRGVQPKERTPALAAKPPMTAAGPLWDCPFEHPERKLEKIRGRGIYPPSVRDWPSKKLPDFGFSGSKPLSNSLLPCSNPLSDKSVLNPSASKPEETQKSKEPSPWDCPLCPLCCPSRLQGWGVWA